ncbi:DNA-binding protein, partial [Escherichia coli]
MFSELNNQNSVFGRQANCRQQAHHKVGNDSNLLIVFYVQIMPDD